MTLSPGESVGPYRIIDQLGSGGMATVFKAYHPLLDRYVAIKVLHPAFKNDPQFFNRFKREARIVANLEHANIIPVYDFNEHAGEPYLVMRFIEGDTLKAHMRGEPIPLPQVLTLMRPVCRALQYAHNQGVLHRDIKPSNIMITTGGSVFLTDFGLARMVQAGESTLSQDMMVGTPQYISPEQAQGLSDLDGRTDIYSLGVVLYEMLTGRVPFSADTPFATIHDHIYTPLPLPSDINPRIDPAIERLLLKTLAKEPVDRYLTAQALLDALETTLSKSVVEPVASSIPGETKSGVPWWGWVGAAALVLCTVAFLLGGLLLMRNRNQKLLLTEPASGPVAAQNDPGATDADLSEPKLIDTLDQPQAETLTDKANKALRQKKYDTAIELFQQAIAVNPHYLQAYYGLSTAQRQQGEDQAALATLEQAVRNNPDSGTAWARLGESQIFIAKTPDAALISFKEAAALEPEGAIPYAGQGLALVALGRSEEAKEAIDTAFSLDGSNPEAHLANAFYLKHQGQPRLAVQELRKIVQNSEASIIVRARARSLLTEWVN